tara:strand:- start:603 stop:722 length:120 start_codon:yes stop_codon:yes gene_type:complete
VSWFTIYALFGMPLVALAIGAGVYYFTAPGRRHPMHPGE